MSATFRVSANPDDGVRAEGWTGYDADGLPRHLGWITIKVGGTEIVVDDITREQARSIAQTILAETPACP